MKTTTENKITDYADKKRTLTIQTGNVPTANWVPLAAFALTALIGIITYTVCTHIPVVDYCSNGAIYIFG